MRIYIRFYNSTITITIMDVYSADNPHSSFFVQVRLYYEIEWQIQRCGKSCIPNPSDANGAMCAAPSIVSANRA